MFFIESRGIVNSDHSPRRWEIKNLRAIFYIFTNKGPSWDSNARLACSEADDIPTKPSFTLPVGEWVIPGTMVLCNQHINTVHVRIHAKVKGSMDLQYCRDRVLLYTGVLVVALLWRLTKQSAWNS